MDEQATNKPTASNKRKIGKVAKPFVCHICPSRAYKHPSGLRVHMLIHDEEKKQNAKIHECSYCDYKARKPSLVRIHERTHTGEKPCECHICGYCCAKKSGLQIHMKKHDDETPFACHLCDYRGKLKYALKKHMERHNGKHQCHICHKNLASRVYLATHIELHTSTEGTYTCSDCSEEFTDKVFLMEHKKKHRRQREDECEYCGKKFSILVEFHNHRQAHARHPEKLPFNCTICEKRYAADKLPAKHKEWHTKHSCDKCGETTFSSDWAFQKHLKAHRKEDRPSGYNVELNLKCHLCDSMFKNVYTIFKHVTEEHSEIKTLLNDKEFIECPICRQSIGTTYNKFAEHFLLHTGRAYKCKTCPKIFSGAAHLKRHEKKHDTHLCKHCGVSFSSSMSRTRHEIHHIGPSGKVHFKCKECQKDLKDGPKYAAHYMVHYNQRKFGCNVCSLRFNDKNKFSGHITSAHKEKKNDTLFADVTAEKMDSESDCTDSEDDNGSDNNEGSEEDSEDDSSSKAMNTDCPEEKNARTKCNSNLIEHSSLPLAAVVFEQVTCSKDNTILVWLNKLETDVLCIAKLYPSKLIVFWPADDNNPTDVFCQTTVQFSTQSLNGSELKWNTHSFDRLEKIRKIKNKQFKSFGELETTLCEPKHSINIVRYSVAGVYTSIKHQMKGNVIVCNYSST